MNKILLTSALSVVMMGCSLLSPYQITFTTRENEAFNPVEDTLNFVISSNALAYVSSYQCGESEEVTLLPVLKDDMVAQMAQYLNLDFLADQEDGTLCSVNITAYDTSTTSTSRAKINLYMYSAPIAKANENEFCGGIAAMQCENGFSCKLTGDFPDAGGVCVRAEEQINEDEVAKQLKDACVVSGGEWKECTDDTDNLCEAKCEFKAEETKTEAAVSTEAAEVTPIL